MRRYSELDQISPEKHCEDLVEMLKNMGRGYFNQTPIVNADKHDLFDIDKLTTKGMAFYDDQCTSAKGEFTEAEHAVLDNLIQKNMKRDIPDGFKDKLRA